MSKKTNRVIVKLYSMLFANRKNDRFGRVLITKTVTEDELIDTAVKRGTDLNPATLRASLNILKKIAKEEIANGASVHFGLGYFDLQVNGVFIGDNPKWDDDRHSLRVNIKPNLELRNMLKDIEVEVRGMAQSGTIINSITDVASGEVSSRLTPGGAANISGVKIRIVGEDPANGIRLTEQNSGKVVDIALNTVAVNEPSRVVFVVPADLPAGDYKLSITTQHSHSTVLLKKPVTYVFEYLLIV
ncbi:MAG: DUF4469 domain-containing protein [Prevotellaceae bacterium]|nr:DUF4469 domain-containing protein [Prevotellaceae bacterium]